MKNYCRAFVVCISLASLSYAASSATTGQLSLTDSSGKVVPTYQSGDSVYIKVADSDGNTNTSVADTLTVIITSETEDTGTPFSASEPAASSSNVGDGTLTVVKTSYDTKTEDWSILAVSANSFLVTGSVSGQQSQQYNVGADGAVYTSDNNEISFTIKNGSVAFKTGDTFTFSTVAGTIVGETVTLTETDVDTGIFTSSISLNEVSAPNTNDGILDVQSGDLITAFYDDAQGDWGGAEQVRSTALYAATVVKGSTLLADAIWTEENSPYLVTGDVTVSANTTLTIMPGVKVLFLANSDDTVGGQSPYDSELIIKGTLNVAGTDAKGITLTSSNREPATGDWGGVRVESGTASLAYTTFEYSAYGIDLYEVSYGKTFTLNNSELANNGTGIKASSSYGGVFALTNNTIRDNSSYAVYSNSSYAHWSLDNNVISDNGQLLRFDWEYSVSLTNNEITNNQGRVEAGYIINDFIFISNAVSGNAGYGLYFYSHYSTGDSMTDSIVVEDNVIDDNGYYGIYIYSAGSADPAINRNKVRNNAGYGIYIQTSDNNTQPSIHDNEITGNGDIGLYVWGKAVPSIVGNIIDNNGSGIYVNYDDVNGNGDFELSGNVITNNQGYGVSVNGYAKPLINGNDIYGNTGYALENHTSFALNVKNNWWGEDATAEINTGTNPKALSFIYDGNANGSAGKVNYAGWLNASGGTPVADSMTGQLSLTDSSGVTVPTYQDGESVYIKVTDSDGNTNTSVADTLTVIITSETEDTGTPFSASEPAASSSNVGDGTLTVVKTSYDTKTEDWSILAVSANSFLVTGSVSGQQSQQYNVGADGAVYTSDNNEISFTIKNGSVAFKTGDTFTFSTVAGTIVGETVTLTETDVDTGIFTSSISLNEVSAPNTNDGILDVQSGDLITAFYDDAQGDWGGAEQVRSTALYAATVVKGSTLLADAIWTEENSPYLVTGDVTVSANTTLTIMPGVKVLFLANSDDTVGGQSPYDSELIIKGTLNVAGTDAKGITLTSSNREPATGDWGGVRVESGTASLAYTTFEYSAYGIDLYEVSYGKTFTLNNSELANNGTGIKASSSYGGVFALTNNTIRDNSSYAVYSNSSYAHWSLDNNVISDNGQLLRFDWEYSVSLTNNEITNNQGRVEAGYIINDFIFISNAVSGNAGYGLYFYSHYSTGDSMTDSIVVEDNVIDDNGYYGIYIYSAGSADPAINRNKVRNNAGYGIYIQTSDNNTQPSIHDNEITGNGDIGLYVWGKAVPSIVGNIIDNNGSGIYVNYDDVNGNGDFELSGNVITNNQGYGVSVNGYAKPLINGNDIYGNTGYALENHTSFALNVKNNWWGEDATAEINTGTNPKALSFIYDGNANGSAGKVNYAGWLNASGGTPVADSMTGQLSLTDSSGVTVPTYQDGESVYIKVTDSDGNTNTSVADTLTVIITSETEDTGTPFSASEPAASSSNVGDGTLTVVKTSYDTKTEDWSILAVSANSFLVTGSVSGQQSQQYNVGADGAVYTSDNNEISFTIKNGSVAFKTGDTFTFSTVAGTIVGETVTLTETDVDTGIFTSSISLNEVSAPNTNDGILDVQSGDLITAFYDDAQGDWGGAEQVRSTALYAATVVKGSTLLADAIWTEENSPYLVTGDVTVSANTTLTIMPGVKVLFLANSDDTVGGQSPYDSELIIKGTLNVAGTDAKGITLTSSNREPATGDWGGVRVESGTASLAYTTFEYSAYGIDLYEVSYGKTFTLNNSELANNGTGIKASSSYGGVFALTNNTIRDNSSYAVYSNSSYAHWSLDNNVISDNGQLLRFDWEYSVSLTNNEITNNQGRVEAGYIINDFIFISNAVSGNAGYGLYFYSHYSTGDSMTDSIVVEDNVIDDNGYYGIYIYSAGSADPAINRNKVRNNAGYGIYIQTSDNNTQPSIHDNEITGNGDIGLYVWGKAVPSIVGNIIDNNGSGIYVNYDDVNGNGDFELSGNVITNNQGYGVSVNGYAKPLINGNDIYGNTGYALENHTSFALNVKNNWWGEDATAEINTGTNPKALSFIYDGNANGSAGKVNYAGWLTQAIAGISMVKHDTDGDGNADILWRNINTGQNWLWTMKGRSIISSAGINVIAEQAWQIVGRGDFDGDGKSDILWRNSNTGRNYIYLMDGFTIKQQGQLNYVRDTNWQVAEVADVDDDGKDDVIWRHAAQGRTWIYLMNGMTTKASQGSLTIADLNWEIVASGDVNGDGKADVIWRHKTRGDNYVWLMDGTQIANRYVLNRVASSDWTIAGVGDLNGDGTDDIIWRNQNDGRNWAYLMNGGQIQTSSLINTVGNTNWQIADISDLNGDGKADLFWRQGQSGQSYIYLMNGMSINSSGYSNTVNPVWQIIK